MAIVSPDQLHSKPPCSAPDALAVLKRLREGGHEAYFAGGCVRDLLLGRTPKDYDVATDAPPDKVRRLFPNTQAVGAAFGVILVRQQRSVVEVATFRADAEYVDGRHPAAVRFTTAREDAQRRDFTINGLFLDPLKSGGPDEQVIDYVGGRADLAAQIIRAIGDPGARFAEDHLRLLRAVRFAARFGFTIEPVTAAAIREHARQLPRISPERIADELRTMLTAPTRAAADQMLGDLGLRKIILRSLALPTGSITAAVELNGSEKKSLLGVLEQESSIAFGLALAAMAIDEYLRVAPCADPRALLPKPTAQKIVRAFRQSLKISNDESDDLLGTMEGLDPLLNQSFPSVARLKRFLAQPTSKLSRQLLTGLKEIQAIDVADAQQLEVRLVNLEKTDFAPAPLITGDDLTAAGHPPGPKFKHVLDTVYDAQLENRLSTRDDAMRLADELFRC